MSNMEARQVLADRLNDLLMSFGAEEGNAIFHEVQERMGEDGSTVRVWMEMIDQVIVERHPILRYGIPKVN